MNKRSYFAVVAILSVIFLSSSTITSRAYEPPIFEQKDLPMILPRTSPLNITVVFIGFDPTCVNTTYLTWMLYQWKQQQTQIPGNDWGVNFTFSYKYVFTNQTFRQDFEAFLNSIQIVENRRNPYYDPPPGTRLNVFYNANKVEEYLYPRLLSVGALPTNGYTAVLLNVSSAWIYGDAQPHYYNMTYYDADSSAVVKCHWMLGWGGHHRFWFLDVSAGTTTRLPFPNDGFNLYYEKYYFEPIWSIVASYPEVIDLYTIKGRNFLTEYVSDFLYGMTFDLFAPDFVYPPRISTAYDIVIYAIDNCTGLFNSTKPLIDATRIVTSFKLLIPYADFTVAVKYIHLNGTIDPPLYAGLWNVIRSAEFPTTSSVDLAPVWEFLEGTLGSFITQTPGRMTIPVFAFQFKDDYTFSSEGKGVVRPPAGDGSPTTAIGGQLWGISLYDMVLVSHSQDDTVDGYGFTQTIIHEVGHELGVMHPMSYDWLQDFTASAMAYYTYEYRLSLFDIDAIWRGHADYYLIRAFSLMHTALDFTEWKQPTAPLVRLLNNAYDNLTIALAHYDVMNYNRSRSYAKTSLDLLTQFIAQVALQPPFDETPPIISSLQVSPVIPTPSSQVQIDVTVTDAVSGVKNVSLFYAVGNSPWQRISMSNLGGGSYTATIPQTSAGSIIFFYVLAYDRNENPATSLVGYYIVQSLSQAAMVPLEVMLLTSVALLLGGFALGLIIFKRPHK